MLAGITRINSRLTKTTKVQSGIARADRGMLNFIGRHFNRADVVDKLIVKKAGKRRQETGSRRWEFPDFVIPSLSRDRPNPE